MFAHYVLCAKITLSNGFVVYRQVESEEFTRELAEMRILNLAWATRVEFCVLSFMCTPDQVPTVSKLDGDCLWLGNGTLRRPSGEEIKPTVYFPRADVHDREEIDSLPVDQTDAARHIMEEEDVSEVIVTADGHVFPKTNDTIVPDLTLLTSLPA